MSLGRELKDFLSAYTGMSNTINNNKLTGARAKYYNEVGKAYEGMAGANGEDSPLARAVRGARLSVPGDKGQRSSAIPTDDNDNDNDNGSVPAPKVTPKGNTRSADDEDNPTYDMGVDEESGDPPALDHMAYLVGKGVDPKVAAGLVGNLNIESRGDPMAVGDGGQSVGLYQFNAGGRRPDFEAWAKANGRDPSTYDAQHDFVIHDLQTNYPKVYKAMQNAPDARTAAALFMRGYERPAAATARLSDRQAAASHAFQLYKSQLPQQEASAPVPSAPDASTGTDNGSGPRYAIDPDMG